MLVFVGKQFAVSAVTCRWDPAEPAGDVWSSWTQISATCWTSTTTSCVSQSRQLVVCPQVKWLTNWSVLSDSVFINNNNL